LRQIVVLNDNDVSKTECVSFSTGRHTASRSSQFHLRPGSDPLLSTSLGMVPWTNSLDSLRPFEGWNCRGSLSSQSGDRLGLGRAAGSAATLHRSTSREGCRRKLIPICTISPLPHQLGTDFAGSRRTDLRRMPHRVDTWPSCVCLSDSTSFRLFFFLFIHYSYATYLDHDEGRSPYVQSVSCPQSAQWRLAASAPFALRPGLSQKEK